MRRYLIHPLAPQAQFGPVRPDQSVVIAELVVESHQHAHLAVLIPSQDSSLRQIFSGEDFSPEFLDGPARKKLALRGLALVPR